MGLAAERIKERFPGLYDRIMVAAYAPMEDMVFDEAELNMELDDLLAMPAYVPPKPEPDASPKLPLSGAHPIYIRVPVGVIRAYKAQAKKTGGNYQTIMNRALREAAASFI